MSGVSKPAACALLAVSATEEAVASAVAARSADVTKLKHAPERGTGAHGSSELLKSNNSAESRER